MDYHKNYHIGDTVIIQIPDTNSRVIGKIEDILQQGKEKIIRYNEFYFPDNTSGKHILILKIILLFLKLGFLLTTLNTNSSKQTR